MEKEKSIDLRIIEKKYGEKMMHLCRELFPTLLLTEGLLSELMLKSFEPSRFLYDDIINSKTISDFQDYIYSLVNDKNIEIVDTNKSPEELMNLAGYTLYECKTEEEIQRFRKYYERREQLCTFHDKQGRLSKCYVFFAVKKNVHQIFRKDFKDPQKHDEYGTSVISIQFKKGRNNILSIKNRYNHSVNNPDSTFFNNLENIIPGLTQSFEEKYNLNIMQNQLRGFELLNYTDAQDGRYYKYNYGINDIYYCPNNVIIDNFEVKRYAPERYIVIDYFILDLKDKTIELYDKSIKDSFVDGIKGIEKINVVKLGDTGNKKIEIITKSQNIIVIEIDKLNKITSYTNNKLIYLRDNFLIYNRCLNNIDLPKLESVGDSFLLYNESITNVMFPKLIKVGNFFMQYNRNLINASFPVLLRAGDDCLSNCVSLEEFNAPNLKQVGDYLLESNNKIKHLNLSKLVKAGKGLLKYSNSIESYNLSNLDEQSKLNLKEFFDMIENKEFIKEKREKLKKERNKIINAYVMGLISDEEYQEKIKDINKLK